MAPHFSRCRWGSCCCRQRKGINRLFNDFRKPRRLPGTPRSRWHSWRIMPRRTDDHHRVLQPACCAVALRSYPGLRAWGARCRSIVGLRTLILALVFHHDFHQLPKAYQAFGIAGTTAYGLQGRAQPLVEWILNVPASIRLLHVGRARCRPQAVRPVKLCGRRPGDPGGVRRDVRPHREGIAVDRGRLRRSQGSSSGSACGRRRTGCRRSQRRTSAISCRRCCLVGSSPPSFRLLALPAPSSRAIAYGSLGLGAVAAPFSRVRR